MSGLRKICKAYGGMTINGVKFVWDYAIDEPVRVEEMPIGSGRHKQSERVKWLGKDQSSSLATSAIDSA